MTTTKEPLEVAGPKTTLRLVKMESALRIIVSLCFFSLNENNDTRGRIIAAIRKEAQEALE